MTLIGIPLAILCCAVNVVEDKRNCYTPLKMQSSTVFDNYFTSKKTTDISQWTDDDRPRNVLH